MVSQETLDYLDSMQKNARPNMWERPEEVARSVLEVEPNKNNIINSDTTKANLNPLELRSYRAIAGVINLTIFAEENHGWNLYKVKRFLEQENISTTVPSRAKSGWAISLAKTTTNVNVNEIKEHAVSIQNEFDQKKGFLQKLPIVGGMLGRKGE